MDVARSSTASELSHDDSLGRGIHRRLSDFGYPTNTSIWENAAAGGELDGIRVVPLRIDSPPHHDNILASSARATGLARARNDNGRWYWTLDMGSSLSDDDRLNIEGGVVAPEPPASTWALVGWSAPDRDVATAAVAFGWTSAVFGWNPAVLGFDTYFSAAPPSINSLETLRTGQAYWVELDPSDSVPQLPVGPTDGLVLLSGGLSLVSWLGPGGVSLADVARSVGPGLLTVWAWDFERQRYVVYSPILPVELGDYSLSTGGGLWVSVDRSIAWQQTP